MQVILAARASGHGRAALAFGLYVARLREGIGAMAAALGGIDALIFTGGVGEHASEVRAAACKQFGWIGLALDDAANSAAVADAEVATPESDVRVLVLHTREELMVARKTAQVLHGLKGARSARRSICMGSTAKRFCRKWRASSPIPLPARSEPMGRYLVPAAMAAAMLAFVIAALAVGLTPYQPGWWGGAVSLAVLGGITPMIYAVNLRIVPVFARRSWPSAAWPRLQMGLAIAGAWVVFAGIIADNAGAVIAGSALTLGGGIVFVANIARLFRQPATLPAPPLPYPGQADVDRIATRFMRLAGVYLVIGLGVGLFTSAWRPAIGRWDLVWAHAMLVGFFLSMASGVCYHVLARWTGRSWTALPSIRLHFAAVALGLPVMLFALATDRAEVFTIAGPLQAVAIGLFLVNIAPMIPALPDLTRPAFAAAAVLLSLGLALGAVFAIEPAIGARLRLAHAEVNLFGWAGLLISGAGYYLVPRFAGQPLRWPLLAIPQLSALIAGVGLGAAALAWRAYGDGPASLVLAAQGLVCAGFLLFGIQVAGTFLQQSVGTVAALPLRPRPASTPAMGRQR